MHFCICMKTLIGLTPQVVWKYMYVIMKKFGLPVNYARHARGNAGNGANIDKHHHQGIFLGVPRGRREATKINIEITHT